MSSHGVTSLVSLLCDRASVTEAPHGRTNHVSVDELRKQIFFIFIVYTAYDTNAQMRIFELKIYALVIARANSHFRIFIC